MAALEWPVLNLIPGMRRPDATLLRTCFPDIPPLPCNSCNLQPCSDQVNLDLRLVVWGNNWTAVRKTSIRDCKWRPVATR